MADLDGICEVLGAMTQSLIGSTNSIKCITDGEDVAFVNCVDQLLQNIQIQNKIADIIVSAVSSHHRNYKCSCKTLLTLILAWTHVIGDLKKQQGVPLSVILGNFHQAVMFCVDHAADISVKVKDIQSPSKQCQMEGVRSHGLCTVNSSFSSNSNICGATEDESLLKQGSAALGENIKENPLHMKELGSLNDITDSFDGHRSQLSLSPNNVLKSLPTVRQNVHGCDDLNADDDDDLSWFFEDEGVMPSDAITKLQKKSMDKSGVNLCLHNNSFTEFGINSYHPGKLNQVPNHSMLVPKVTQTIGEVSSLQNVVDDGDEFDSCFNEDYKAESPDDFKLKTVSCVMMKKKEAVADDGYKNSDHDDNEFDICFKEESSSSDMPVHVLTTNSLKTQDSLTSFQEHKKLENRFPHQEKGTPTTAMDPVSVRLFLENRLQEVLKKKCKEDLKMRVFNRCRHLTTLKSTVSELQQSVKHEQQQSKWSMNQRMSSDHQHEVAHPEKTTMNSSPALEKQSTQTVNSIKVETSDIVSETQNDPVDYKTITISSSRSVGQLSHNEKDDVNKTEMERDGRHALLCKLTRMLSHGAEEVVPLVASVCWNQMKEKKTSLLSSIRLSSVHTHAVVGPIWEHSSVVDGAVLNTTDSQLTVLSRLSGPYRVLLIHGDLQHSYKHKGQQVKQDQVTILKQPMAESKEAVWLKELQSIIRKLSIQVLLLSGIASDSALDLCDNMDVLLLTKLPYSILAMLGEAYQVDYVKYITEATEICRAQTRGNGGVKFIKPFNNGSDEDFKDFDSEEVLVKPLNVACQHGHVTESDMCLNNIKTTNVNLDMKLYNFHDNMLYPLMVDPYNSGWRDKVGVSSNSNLVVIRTPTTLLQTCVMCHPCQNVVMLREEQFWHCVKRLASCIHSNKILPGGGATELSCAVQLRKYADKLEANASPTMLYDAIIYSAVAEGFEQFTSVVLRNSTPETKTDLTAGKLIDSHRIITGMAETTDTDHEVFDDFESKIEAWQTACHVTCQLLLADMEITTGLEMMDKKIII